MMIDTAKGLPFDYRQEETTSIARCIHAGDSCSIVGVSGTAKSNLFRHLLNSEVRHHYLGEGWQSYLFLAIDAHALADFSERVMYDFLLERLTAEIRERGVSDDLVARVKQFHQQTLPSADPLDWQRAFTQAVGALMTAEATHHLVFLFDQFDEVYETLNPRFFANLRSIRDDFKYRVSYVTFTREELPHIRSDAEHDEFFELLSPNVIGLGCYNHDDAWTVLRRVGGRYGMTPDSTVSERLIAFTEGHPGLLKAAFLAFIQERVSLSEDDEGAVRALLADRDVRTECTKIWESIGQEEQAALRALPTMSASTVRSPLRREALELLQVKKLIVEREERQLAIFCPIFERFVAEQRAIPVPETRVTAGAITIDAARNVWVEGCQVEPSLGKLEFTLLSYLCSRPGETCTRDEIGQAVYGQYAEFDDNRIDTLVRRVRDKIEPDSSNPRYIVTVWGHGYKLTE